MELKRTLRKLEKYYQPLVALLSKGAQDGKLNFQMGKTLASVEEEFDNWRKRVKALQRDGEGQYITLENGNQLWIPKAEFEAEYHEAFQSLLDTEVEIYGRPWKASFIQKQLKPQPREWAAAEGWLVLGEIDEDDAEPAKTEKAEKSEPKVTDADRYAEPEVMKPSLVVAPLRNGVADAADMN